MFSKKALNFLTIVFDKNDNESTFYVERTYRNNWRCVFEIKKNVGVFKVKWE